MKKIILSGFIGIMLLGCTSDPTLASSVYRQGGGIYETSYVRNAVKQCDLENKEIDIITSAQKYNYVVKSYIPSYIFKCVDKKTGNS